jgi:hypothetical protein
MRSPKRARKAPQSLRCQRDLGHQDDRAAATLERRRTRLEVHLRLAAAGRAVQQIVRALPRVQLLDDPLERRRLRVAERCRLGLAGQRVALCRLRTLAARLPLNGRDELEGPSRRRAVVVRHPQGQLDERARQLLHDTLDGRSRHAVGRGHSHLGHDTAPLRVPEADLDHRARLDLVRNLVRELACERAGGDEREDGRVAAQDDQRRVAP